MASTSQVWSPALTVVHRAVVDGVCALDLDAGHDVDAALLERPDEQADDVVVASRQDGVERLEDRDLGAEVGQQRGELAADHPAADDRDRGRQLLEVEELVRGHDPAPVDLEAGQDVRAPTRQPARRCARRRPGRRPSPSTTSTRRPALSVPGAG